jgi:hypothetical protein
MIAVIEVSRPCESARIETERLLSGIGSMKQHPIALAVGNEGGSGRREF